MSYDEFGRTIEAWKGEGTSEETRLERNHEPTVVLQQGNPVEMALNPTSESPSAGRKFDTVIESFHQEFDSMIRTAFADAMNRVAQIESKAEAEAEALLGQAHDEKAQLEVEVANLRQERDQLAQILSQTLLSLDRGLQALTSTLGQANAQMKQHIEILKEAGVQLESLKPTAAEVSPGPEEEAVVEEHRVVEGEVIEAHRIPEQEAVTEHRVTEEEPVEVYRRHEPEEEVIEEHRVPELEEEVAVEPRVPAPQEEVITELRVTEQKAAEEYRPPEDLPISETRVRIIGLRQIAWLHRIEGSLAANPAVEDVRTIKYSEGVLVLSVRHRPTSLVEILKGIPGLAVQDVRDVGEWIKVYLGDSSERPDTD
jgi:biotin operon repressor